MLNRRFECRPVTGRNSPLADLVLKVDRLPKAGETLGASSLDFFPGGKGANQAAAAAKLGRATVMIGQLGTDSNAESLLQGLESAGVQTQHIQRIQGPSGTAVILLQSSGNKLQPLLLCNRRNNQGSSAAERSPY